MSRDDRAEPLFPFLRSMPKSVVDLVSEKAEALVGSPSDFDSLVDLIGDARFVLIGEASHGTHEFYRIRAQISKVLIAQRGFNAVAVEADWPDAYRVNRFVRGAGSDIDSVEALSGFQRFPQWMWRNADVLDFVGWLREHNDQQVFEERKCGFYGLDLYSLHASIEAVLAYLDKRRSGSGKTRAASLQLFRTFRKGHHNLRVRRWFSHDAVLRGSGCEKPRRAAPESDGLPATGRPGCSGRVLLRRAKRAGRAERRRILPQHVSSRSFLVEPARHPHDGIAPQAGNPSQ